MSLPSELGNPSTPIVITNSNDTNDITNEAKDQLPSNE